MKQVNDCKDVCVISLQNEQYTVTFCFTKYNRVQSKHKQTNCKHSIQKSYGIQHFSVGITILNQSII